MTRSPFILEEDPEYDTAAAVHQSARIIEDASNERIVIEIPQAELAPSSSRRARSYRWPIILCSIGILGWVGISLGNWVVALGQTNWAIGMAAALSVAAIVAGALLWIGSELRSLRQLQKVDTWHARLSLALNDVPATHSLITEIGKALPNTPTTASAVGSWTRNAPGYRSGETIEIFDDLVLGPLDVKALAIVRRATRDAFGLVALSPTLIVDTVVFTARATSLVRAVAEVYGHRPGYAATFDLMRKIAGSVGTLVATDFVLDAAASVTGNLASSGAEHITGAVAGAAGHVAKSERITKAAAEGAIAAQRMGRLGLLAMHACRPLPFREGKKPGFKDILLGWWVTT